MFGYFRFLNQYSDYQTQAVYKNYYCGLCFALDMHYGISSRMLLSYDVTLLAIAIHAHRSPDCERIKCLGCGRCKKDLFDNEDWKKIAAINILLAAEKLRDDIEDERSAKATIASYIYKGKINQAKLDYPEIYLAVRSGYDAILIAEKEGKDVLEIGDSFADLMIGVMDSAFTVSDTIRMYVREISRWLYFIDALDDYDEDLEKHRFNPIADPTMKYKEFVSERYEYISEIINNLYSQHNELITALADQSSENEILISILKNSIPAVTSMVLNNYKLPTLMHFKPGNVWRVKS